MGGVIFSLLLIVGCSKQENANQTIRLTKEETLNVQKEIGKIIAPALQDPEAKKEILSKSITNSGNDYYVKISDIIALAETNTNSTIARSVKSKTLQLSEFASK
ncbi:MAG: hypothetical protein ACK5NK_11745, partial [Niabella sp.]